MVTRGWLIMLWKHLNFSRETGGQNTKLSCRHGHWMIFYNNSLNEFGPVKNLTGRDSGRGTDKSPLGQNLTRTKTHWT